MKVTVFLITLGFLFIAGAIAYAHPPSDISITFDPQTKMLHAVIMHDVVNPLNHYIKKVDVALNGKEALSQSISRQDTAISQTVSYLIPDAQPGDTVSIEGYCSIMGKLEKEIKVPSITPSTEGKKSE